MPEQSEFPWDFSWGSFSKIDASTYVINPTFDLSHSQIICIYKRSMYYNSNLYFYSMTMCINILILIHPYIVEILYIVESFLLAVRQTVNSIV